MNSKPTALCIGGPFDGRISEYDPEGQYVIMMALPAPVRITDMDQRTAAVEVARETYRIDRIRAWDKTGFTFTTVLVHESLTLLQALEHLLESHREHYEK